jgi:hypothetical protein
MVNNSTNINKHTQSPLKKVLNSDGQQFCLLLLWKESLNCDVLQFNQSPLKKV